MKRKKTLVKLWQGFLILLMLSVLFLTGCAFLTGCTDPYIEEYSPDFKEPQYENTFSCTVYDFQETQALSGRHGYSHYYVYLQDEKCNVRSFEISSRSSADMKVAYHISDSVTVYLKALPKNGGVVWLPSELRDDGFAYQYLLDNKYKLSNPKDIGSKPIVTTEPAVTAKEGEDSK